MRRFRLPTLIDWWRMVIISPTGFVVPPLAFFDYCVQQELMQSQDALGLPGR